VQCSTGTCPAHSTCNGTGCVCNAGYSAMLCNGAQCGGLFQPACAYPGWWCH
jgi:hypothetical protein